MSEVSDGEQHESDSQKREQGAERNVEPQGFQLHDEGEDGPREQEDRNGREHVLLISAHLSFLHSKARDLNHSPSEARAHCKKRRP